MNMNLLRHERHLSSALTRFFTPHCFLQQGLRESSSTVATGTLPPSHPHPPPRLASPMTHRIQLPSSSTPPPPASNPTPSSSIILSTKYRRLFPENRGAPPPFSFSSLRLAHILIETPIPSFTPAAASPTARRPGSIFCIMHLIRKPRVSGRVSGS